MKRTILLAAMALMISAAMMAQNGNQNRNQNQTGTQVQSQVQDQNQVHRGNRNQTGPGTQRQIRDRMSTQDCMNQQRYNSQVRSATRNSGVCNNTMQRSGMRMSGGPASGRR